MMFCVWCYYDLGIQRRYDSAYLPNCCPIQFQGNRQNNIKYKLKYTGLDTKQDGWDMLPVMQAQDFWALGLMYIEAILSTSL